MKAKKREVYYTPTVSYTVCLNFYIIITLKVLHRMNLCDVFCSFGMPDGQFPNSFGKTFTGKELVETVWEGEAKLGR